MIIVFVVDTSPSMGLPVSATQPSPALGESTDDQYKAKGMSRLDLAKMTVVS